MPAVLRRFRSAGLKRRYSLLQHLKRIDSKRPPSWRITRGEADHGQQPGSQNVSGRIVRVYSIKLLRDQASTNERRGTSKNTSDSCEPQIPLKRTPHLGV